MNNKELKEMLNQNTFLEVVRDNTPDITQEVNAHYYETATGNRKFGGNYLVGADTSDYSQKLNGTTSIISLIFPFGGMISPAANAWLAKIDRRESKGEDTFMDVFGEETPYQAGIRKINEIKGTLDEEMSRVIENGNYAEIITLHLLQNNGNLEGYEKTVKREEELNHTQYFRTDKAVELGELAYKEIMKLGDNIKLVDYQTVASDKDLWDVGYFDFVVEADGKLILIDMKTGSRVAGAKLEKVRFQLLGSYKKKFKGIFGKNPDRILVICGVEDEIKIGQLKQFKTFGETIDITNDDEDNRYVKAYEKAAELYKFLYDSKILKRSKEENVPMI